MAEEKKGSVLGGLVLIALVGWGLVTCMSGPSEEEKKAAEAKEAACKKDLQCAGDKGAGTAGVYCRQYIEHLAKHDMQWTDGTLDSKFSRFRWHDEKAGTITFIGDKAKFQNGFGAYTPVIYECDFDVEKRQVLDVRVREGRLPI